jgi:hypothetical protein
MLVYTIYFERPAEAQQAWAEMATALRKTSAEALTRDDLVVVIGEGAEATVFQRGIVELAGPQPPIEILQIAEKIFPLCNKYFGRAQAMYCHLHRQDWTTDQVLAAEETAAKLSRLAGLPAIRSCAESSGAVCLQSGSC